MGENSLYICVLIYRRPIACVEHEYRPRDILIKVRPLIEDKGLFRVRLKVLSEVRKHGSSMLNREALTVAESNFDQVRVQSWVPVKLRK